MATNINRSALLPYKPKELFDLVNDIESYPQYMDGCVSSEVMFRDDEMVEARLDLSKGGVSHSFSTRNRMVDAEHIRLELIEGPFDKFEGIWEFHPLGDEACKVSLSLNFNVNNAVLGAAVGRLFEKVTANLVDAVEKRAKQLYG